MYNYEQSDELLHYGVLGMKWGVRRASRSYSKATTSETRKKAKDDLEKHYTKASKKLDKYYTKGNKQLDKAVDKRYGFFGDNDRYEKAKGKAERTMYKGQKWYKNMESTFAKQSVVKLSEKDRAKGRKFASFFEQRAGFTDSMYNYEYY